MHDFVFTIFTMALPFGIRVQCHVNRLEGCSELNFFKSYLTVISIDVLYVEDACCLLNTFQKIIVVTEGIP